MVHRAEGEVEVREALRAGCAARVEGGSWRAKARVCVALGVSAAWDGGSGVAGGSGETTRGCSPALGCVGKRCTTTDAAPSPSAAKEVQEGVLLLPAAAAVAHTAREELKFPGAAGRGRAAGTAAATALCLAPCTANVALGGS